MSSSTTDRSTGAPAPREALDLKSAVAAADPALLLLCLVQVTGDRGLLSRYNSAFHPLEVRSAYTVHEVDEVEAEEIRQLAVQVFSMERSPLENVAIPVPDPALFQQMATLGAGEEVDAEFVSILLEQSGFVSDSRVLKATKTPPPDFKVAVIGAGMVGINAGVKLGIAGFNYTILESRSEVGGTWAINTYPGAAVDTPSSYYSYSFELKADWPNYYPEGDAYLNYLQDVADKYGIREHIEFGTEVQGFRWDESEQVWVISSVQNGKAVEHRANAVITALGTLNRPNKPEFPDREKFAGTVMHTAEWDHSVELAGRKVVVLGTGCTSVQVVSSMVSQVEHLTVIQRQPHWVVPDIGYGLRVPEAEQWCLANIPFYNQWTRFRAYWFVSDNNYGKSRIDPDWPKDLLSVSATNHKLLEYCMSHLEANFGDDPVMMARLTPDFAPYAKRIVKDPGFYDALKEDHVDLQGGTIERFTETGVVLSSGAEVECDVLILATGFKLEYLSQFEIAGRGGRQLADEWGSHPKAYLGVTVPGFPNMFVTCGPNVGSNHGGGHNLTGEEQVHYALECLQHMVEGGITSMEPLPNVTEEYAARVDAELDKTVWQHGGTAHGYYRNAAGKATDPCPWRMVDYWTMLREPVLDDFLVTYKS